MKLFILVSCLMFSLSAFSHEVNFMWGEKEVHSFKLSDFEKGELQFHGKKLPHKTSAVYNPFRKYTKSYVGYDFVTLLDEVYGTKWRKANSIRFMALDGFVQVAPVAKMLEKAKEHEGILAFKESQHKSFEKFEKNGKLVDPGPFYLVWTNFESRTPASYSDHLKWPYQLKSITIVGAP